LSSFVPDLSQGSDRLSLLLLYPFPPSLSSVSFLCYLCLKTAPFGKIIKSCQTNKKAANPLIISLLDLSSSRLTAYVKCMAEREAVQGYDPPFRRTITPFPAFPHASGIRSGFGTNHFHIIYASSQPLLPFSSNPSKTSPKATQL